MVGENVEHEYMIRRKILTIFGAKFHIYNNNGELIGFSKQKAFKLKEDIKIYTDESMATPLVSINARSVIDFSASYDVTNSSTGEKYGALQRKGFSSIIRDSWMFLDTNDESVGTLQEDSAGMAIVRRFVPLGNMFPQKFTLTGNDGIPLAAFRTHFNPFVHRMTVSVFAGCPLSPQLVLAGGVLLLAIEGRQKG